MGPIARISGERAEMVGVRGQRSTAGRALVAGLALVAASMVAVTSGADPAGAAVDTSWRPSPAVVPAGNTYVVLQGAAGEHVSGGGTHVVTPRDNDFFVTAIHGGRVTVSTNGDDLWNIDLTPPESVTALVPGAVYVNLPQFAFQHPTVGGVWVTHSTPDGGGMCDTSAGSVGWFAVDEATYVGGVVQTFTVRFEQRCGSATGLPLRGQIRYDVATPLDEVPTPTRPVPDLWTPPVGARPATGTAAYATSDAADWVGKGRTYRFAGPGVDLTGSHDTLVTAVLDVPGTEDRLSFNVVGSNRTDRLEAGYYADLLGYPSHNRSRGGISITGNGAGCGSRGWFVVDEVDQLDGTLHDVTLRFEHRCGPPGGPAMRGVLHWEPPAPAGAPAPPSAVVATPTIEGASVTWAAPAEVGSGPITGYEITTYEEGTVRRAAVTVGPDARTASIPDLAVGVDHTFKVRAVSAAGASQRSAATVVVRPWDEVPAVLGLTPAEGVRTGGTQVQLTGTALGNATAVTVGGIAVPFTPVSPTRIDVTAPALAVGPHPVVVTTDRGTGTGAAPATWTSRPIPMGPAGDLVATPGPLAVALTWTAPATGDGPLTGWTLAATEAGAATAQVLSALPAGATTARLTGLTPGATYRIDLRASGAGGPGTVASIQVQVPPPDTGPFATVAALVRQLHRDLLGREGTAAEVAAGVDAVASGRRLPEEYVAEFATRPAWAASRAPVVRLYAAYFDRLPDAGGLAYWSAKVRSGTGLAQVSATFAASAEFRRTYGPLGNRSFVLRIYANVLKRTPDAGGVAYWTRKLDGGTSRGVVMNNFSESSENVRTTGPAVDVVLLHLGLLRVTPTASVVADQVAELAAGASRADLARQLLDSAAYAARFS